MSGTGMSGTGTTWHVPADLLAAFHDGSIGPVDAASVEAHLITCEQCRAAVAGLRGSRPDAASRADAGWARIVDRIDRPSRRMTGASPWVMVTLGTPALRLAAAIAAVLVAAVPLALESVSTRLAVATYVLLAPLVPLGGVLAAFRPSVDPSGEMGLASPLATLRLVLVRALVVAGAALPLGVLVAFVLPAPTTLLLGWLLPGIALAFSALALGRRAPVEQVVAGLSLLWATAATTVFVAMRTGSVEAALDAWVVNQPAAQVASALVAVIAAVAALRRRDDTIVIWSER